MVRLAGKVSSGRLKFAPFGSCNTSNGSCRLPRKLACCPGVIEPSEITCGYATNVGMSSRTGASLSTIEPYAGYNSSESRKRWSSLGGGCPESA